VIDVIQQEATRDLYGRRAVQAGDAGRLLPEQPVHVARRRVGLWLLVACWWANTGHLGGDRLEGRGCCRRWCELRRLHPAADRQPRQVAPELHVDRGLSTQRISRPWPGAHGGRGSVSGLLLGLLLWIVGGALAWQVGGGHAVATAAAFQPGLAINHPGRAHGRGVPAPGCFHGWPGNSSPDVGSIHPPPPPRGRGVHFLPADRPPGCLNHVGLTPERLEIRRLPESCFTTFQVRLYTRSGFSLWLSHSRCDRPSKSRASQSEGLDSETKAVFAAPGSLLTPKPRHGPAGSMPPWMAT